MTAPEFQMAELKKQVGAANRHPLNRAALRWIREAQRARENPRHPEAGPLDNEIHVTNHLGWSLELLREQNLIQSWRADALEEEMGTLAGLTPREQTRYFLGHAGEDNPQLEEKLKQAKNLQESASLMVDVYQTLLESDPELMYSPEPPMTQTPVGPMSVERDWERRGFPTVTSKSSEVTPAPRRNRRRR